MTDTTVETELVRLGELLAKASGGKWVFYDKVFRKRFGRGRVIEIQRYYDGKAIVSWSGFDGLPPVTDTKKRHNARLIVAAVNALPTLLPYIATLQARIAEAEGVAEHAFKEAYQLGFLEGYECEPRCDLSDPEGQQAALMQCDGTSEAWSDFRAAAKFLAPKGDVG